MPSNDLIRVAVVGGGRIAGHHCRSMQRVEGMQVAAVCDMQEEKASALGKQFSVPHFVNHHEMLRAVPEIDCVVVAIPSGMHFEFASEVMRTYRKHVIMEKPAFMTPSQVRTAYGLARELGLQIFPVFQNRHNRAVQRVKSALNAGELGSIRIAAVRVRWCRPQRYYNLSAWRGTYAQDGGALTNQGIHHVDLLRYLGGEVDRVNAVMRTLGADIEVEDTVVANLAYGQSAVGVVEVTTAARPDDFEASISLVCEKGLVQIGGVAVNQLQTFTPNPEACAAWSEDFSANIYGEGHVQVYRDIERCLHAGIGYPVDYEDCLRTIKLLHAFYRSDEIGNWVVTDSDEESTRLGRPDPALAELYRVPGLSQN